MELQLKVDKDRLMTSIKTTVAAILGYLIVYFFKIPMGAWILITIIVVMGNQINVGGVVLKSIMQFVGVVIGAAASIAILFFYGTQTIPLTIVLFFSIFIFSYIATSEREINSAGLLGATTVIVTLLSQNPTYQTALLRFFEISLGIFIAFLVSKFIFPIHAYQRIYESIADILTNCISLYETLWNNGDEQDAFSEKESKTITIFSLQRKLMHEASSELSLKIVSQRTYSKILKSQRELFRYICLMHQARGKIEFTAEQTQQFSLFNQHVYFWMEQLVRSLKEKDFKLESTTITNKELMTLIQGFVQSPPPFSSQQLALEAFFFCALNLVRELRKLTRLVLLLIEKRGKKRRHTREQSSHDHRRRRTPQKRVTPTQKR